MKTLPKDLIEIRTSKLVDLIDNQVIVDRLIDISRNIFIVFAVEDNDMANKAMKDISFYYDQIIELIRNQIKH